MASTWVYLARHGEVLHAAEGRFFGHTDVALSPVGVAQAATLGERLAAEPIEAVYASDLLRARESATPLAVARGMDVIALPPLREMAMGRWEGLTAEEIQGREPDAFATWMASVGEFPFPEGESVPDLVARAWPAFEGLAEAHAGAPFAIVAHGGTNRAILCRLLGLPLDRLLAFGQGYGALTVIERAHGRWSVCRLNEEPW